MAYCNENGVIMIDADAANRDIKRLQTAADKLKEVKRAFKDLQRQAENGQGETSRAIMEKAQEMINKINKVLVQISDSQAFIRRTVEKYREIDEYLRSLIENS